MWSGRSAEVESIRGGGVGGAPPPRTGCSSRKVPHNLPLCNTIAVSRPTSRVHGPIPDVFRLQTHGFSGGSRRGRTHARLQARVQITPLQAKLRSAEGARRPAGGDRGGPAGRRAAAALRRGSVGGPAHVPVRAAPGSPTGGGASEVG